MTVAGKRSEAGRGDVSPCPGHGDTPCPQLSRITTELESLRDSDHAAKEAKYFRAYPGGYGEGDRFRGIRMPVLRGIAKKYRDISNETVTCLLRSSFHEDRMLAVLVMVNRFRRASSGGRRRIEERREIYEMYLTHTACINSWDLVDVSAPHIVGAMIAEHGEPREILDTLVKSDSLWERRIAVLSTFHFIRHGEIGESLSIVERLLGDAHDLIHKACGWMLRESAKRDR
ncbi:MAG: DNA alkylation repair protein, partial [Spirochaetota bacterium]